MLPAQLLVGSLSRAEPLRPWQLHARGLYSMLRERGSASILTERGRSAFWPCYSMVQVNALASSSECPPESDEWLGLIGDNLYDGEAFALHVSVFVVSGTRVVARALAILDACDFAAAEAELGELAAALAAAEDEFCARVATTRAPNLESPHSMHAYMLNLYRSAMIKGYHCLVMLANLLTHHAHGSRWATEELGAARGLFLARVRRAAQHIVDGLPEALEELAAGPEDQQPRLLFDAIKMVWPLAAVYTVDSTLPEQKARAEAALTFIGKKFGVRQALNRHPGSRLQPLPSETRRPLGAAAAAVPD